MVVKRYAWAIYMRGLRLSEQWFFDNVVWTDICNTILATTKKKAAELALASKGDRTWCNEDSLADDAALCGDKRALKLHSWDTIRVWWAPVSCAAKNYM